MALEEYKVQLDVFEGPLDLLLYLIKKNEVDIYDIPIETITSQYVDYLGVMRMLDLNIAGEFLVMAATLMMTKSRMLLPVDERPELEEEEDEVDPRWDLVRQLVEYKKFKDAALFLEELDELPDAFPTLRETGFFVGGFGWLPDYVVMPIVMLGVKLGPRLVQQPLARLFARSLDWASKPPFATLLQLEAEGEDADGKQRHLSLRLSHADGYDFTAIPVMACLLQWLEGGARKPGSGCAHRLKCRQRR